ncbi:hypothetical protein WJX74_009796 [Apatococcus lobatus]|uniref:Formamidopyrimidine-DNA glycosylase catalytic domain-containing protein n=1 Tax=Apatococcus lobatus TaxID=904363 RepID=A0AAW1QJ94_9CHLO
MPELPEVENARRLAQQHAAGKKLAKVVVADDDKVIEGIAPKDLEKALTGRTLVATHRKGKQMWFELDGSSPALLLHLGMKGSLKVEGIRSAEYQQGTKDGGEWPPRFWKIQFEMDDGTRMSFNDARRFARVRFLKDPTSVPPISELGFDPLLELPSLDDFVALMAKQRRALKALILDQSFSAGVGNWVADEVLYQAKLHPEQKGNSLDADECKRLHDALYYVCKTATEVDAESSQFPPDWLFHQRWNEKKAQPINGNPLEFIKSAGRATAIVPAVQQLRGQAPKEEREPKKKAAGKRTSDESGDDKSESEVDAEQEPAPPAKKSRGATKPKPASSGAPANGKSSSRKNAKSAGTAATFPDKAPGADAAASKPSGKSAASQKGGRSAGAADKAPGTGRKNAKPAVTAAAAANKAPASGSETSKPGGSSAAARGAGRNGAQPVAKTSNRMKAGRGKQDPAGPTAPSHYAAICSPNGNDDDTDVAEPEPKKTGNGRGKRKAAGSTEASTKQATAFDSGQSPEARQHNKAASAHIDGARPGLLLWVLLMWEACQRLLLIDSNRKMKNK